MRLARWLSLIASAACMLGGCGRAIAPLVVPGRSAVALTGGTNTSMIYLARTSDGVVAIDLGWWGHGPALDRALRELDAERSEIHEVFLTHSHRDHIAAWQLVRHARFHLAEAERSRLIGETRDRAWIPRWANRIKPEARPRAGELTLRPFSQDTAFVIGSDTLRAYLVAGHTAGTAVYLYRGVLFLGDAATYSRWSGFAPAKRGYSDDTRQAALNLERLWARLPAEGVRYVCTAHARCSAYTPRFLADVAR